MQPILVSVEVGLFDSLVQLQAAASNNNGEKVLMEQSTASSNQSIIKCSLVEKMDTSAKKVLKVKKLLDCDTVGLGRKGGRKIRRGGKTFIFDKGEEENEVRKGADSVSMEKGISGETKEFSGQHSEESDICRSNKRQWEVLNSNYGEKYYRQ